MILLLLSLMAAPAWCWWGNGHSLVAQIAALELERTGRSSVMTIATDIVSEYAEFFPATGKNFVASSTWSDNLGVEGVYIFANWHFIDLPFVVDANVTAPDVSDANSVWALQQCTRGLQSKALSPWAASFYLRWIVHLMGDIHQPLHNIAQFSRDFPVDQGDRGGNECKLNATASNITSDITNLHSFWDSAGGLYVDDAFFPVGKPGFTPQFEALYRRQAIELMTAFPRDKYADDMIRSANFSAWAREGYAIAVRDGYMTNASALEQSAAAPSNVAQAIGLGAQLRCKKGKQLTLPPGYVDNVRAITRERLAIAGYRLAAVLVQFLPTHWVPPVNSTLSTDQLRQEVQRLLDDLAKDNVMVSKDKVQLTTLEVALGIVSVVLFVILLAALVVFVARQCRKHTPNYAIVNDADFGSSLD